MFLINPNSYARDPGGWAQKVQSLIETAGGTVLASRLWNEQRLAYPIEGHRKGVYWLTYFEIERTDLVKLNRACRLIDQILRFMVVRLDPRIVDTMVSAARGDRPKPETPDAGNGEPRTVTDSIKETVEA
jgi:small subunit ribosomal protein S6